MLTIGLLSDIHAHRHDHARDVQALVEHINTSAPPNLMLLAGDISHRTSEIAEFLRSLKAPCPRCWVPGNHDLWVLDPETPEDTPERRYRMHFPALSAEVGWHYLPAEPLPLPTHRIAVVGSVGWFTGNGYSEWLDADGTPENDRLAKGFADELATQIETVPTDLQLIVVTHHLSHSGIASGSLIGGNLVNRYLEAVLERHRDRILLVVHGHLHVRYDPIEIAGLRFVAHPFGYPHQHRGVEDGYRLLTCDT